jgi:hypothetical protein
MRAARENVLLGADSLIFLSKDTGQQQGARLKIGVKLNTYDHQIGLLVRRLEQLLLSRVAQSLEGRWSVCPSSKEIVGSIECGRRLGSILRLEESGGTVRQTGRNRGNSGTPAGSGRTHGQLLWGVDEIRRMVGGRVGPSGGVKTSGE